MPRTLFSRRRFIGAAALSAGAVLAPLAASSLPSTASDVTRRSEPSKVVIGTYASQGPMGHSTNTHWVETDDGVFVIDAQWTLPEAESALTAIRETAGDKPLLGLLITHDHTDHYGGLNAFVEAAAAQGSALPIYASAQTRLSIQNDAQGFQRNRKAQFGEAFPDRVAVPDRTVRDGGEIDIGAVQLRVVECYLNEAPSTTMLYVEDGAADGRPALISGDMVYDRRPAIFREQMPGLENWRLQLQGLRADFPEAILYPGHGTARPASDIIPEQIAFLEAFRDPVLQAVERDGQLTDTARAAIRADLLERYRDYVPIIGLAHEDIIDISLRWLAAAVDRTPPEG